MSSATKQETEAQEDEEQEKRQTRPRRPELRAMHAIDGILEDMDPAARSRVVTWLVSVHGIIGITIPPTLAPKPFDLNDPRR